MKKIFTTLLIITLFVSVLTGCKQENTASVVAKNLDNNLNKLTIAVNKLDSIDNKYLANPDIYSSLGSEINTVKGKYFTLAFNRMDNVEQISNESVKQILIDKITDKLLSQNNDCSGNDCYTCKKYCNDNGDCYYQDCNGNNYCYTQSGECFTCDEIPSSCSYSGLKKLSSDESELTATQLNNIEENNIVEENTSNDTDSETTIENNTSDDAQLNTPNPRVKVFYFTQDSFAPIKLKYNPRYISQYNENTINDQIESYLYKVQKLYAMSEDSIEANTILQHCKQNIIDAVNEIRDLNNCMITGNCEPSIQQLQALNNYIVDIKTTTQRLKDCNGELTKEISKISDSNSGVMINSVDVMNSNYMRLLNHIDTRVTYHKSAIATLEQIRYLLDSAINNNEISEEEIENIIEDFTIQEEVEVNDNIIENNNTMNEDNTDDDNILDNDFVDNAVNNGELDKEKIDEDVVLDDFSDTNNNDIIDEEYTTNSDNVVNENIYNNDDKNIVEENIETNSEDVIIEDEIIKNDETLDNMETIKDEEVETNANNIENNLEENETNKNTLLDTYNETNSWSNIDTYKNGNNDANIVIDENNIVDDNNTIIDDNNIYNNFEDTNDNVNNDDIDMIEDNETIVNDDPNKVVNDETINGNLDNNDTIIENGVVNGTTNGGVYQNSVITQNNLNNDNGYGGYYYTNDGEIKNNGMNNNNEIGNNGNTIENNLNRNNNVNTYGYNTLLDIINQGTVNNGINTL